MNGDTIAAFAAVLAIAAGVAVGGWILVEGSSRSAELAPPTGPVRLSVLRDPQALMLADRRRDVLVGLAVRLGGPVETFVAGAPSRSPRINLLARVNARRPPVERCGRGCFRFSADVLRGHAARIGLTVRRPAQPPVEVAFRLPARRPPSASGVLRRAQRTMRRLRSVVVDEFLTAGVSPGIRARFTMVAPDRMRYVTSSGHRAVVIGTRRWDRGPNGWVETPSDRLRMPAFMWDGAGRGRLLGRSRLGGEPVRVIAAFRPGDRYPAWFRLFVTSEQRIVRAEMLAPSHFMVDRISRFDRPARIEPPVRPT
jgi:hypothetical protein